MNLHNEIVCSYNMRNDAVTIKNGQVIKSWNTSVFADSQWLERISIQQNLHLLSPVFPKLRYQIDERSGVLTQIMPYFSIAKDIYKTTEIDDVILKLQEAVLILKSVNHVHGDFLMKNILVTEEGIKLIDHSPFLVSKVTGVRKLNCTFPWVDFEDFKNEEVTVRTDDLCLKATILRLTDFSQYIKLRKEQFDKLKSHVVLIR